jgi:threonine aldolase
LSAGACLQPTVQIGSNAVGGVAVPEFRHPAAFAAAVAAQVPAAVDVAAVQTNIVVLDTGAVPAAQVAAEAKDRGVVVSALGPRMLRAVTHLDVGAEEARTAGEVVGSILVDA